MTEKFRAGVIAWMPDPSDPHFNTEDEAEDAAISMSDKDEGNAYGVWRDDDGELLSVAVWGQLFRK